MILTLFNTLSGFSAYSSLVERAGGGHVEDGKNFQSQPILDTALFVMPRLSDKGIAVLSRYRQKDSVLTWIGVYKPLLAHFSIRGGDYCGAGVFIADCLVGGPFIVKLLDDLLDDVLYDMEQSDPTRWKSQNTYDRSLDHRPALKDIHRHLIEDRPFGGLSSSAEQTCAIQLHKCAKPLGEIVDAAQREDGFASFRRLLVVRDEVAAKAVNTGQISMVDASGNFISRRSLLPSYDIERAPRRPAELSRVATAPQSRRDNEIDIQMRNDSRYIDGSPKPLMTKAGLALVIASLSLLLNFGLLAYVALERQFTESVLANLTEKTALSATQGTVTREVAADSRLSDAGLKTSSDGGRFLSSSQFAMVTETIDQLLSDDYIKKNAESHNQLEQVRDMLRQSVVTAPLQRPGPR